MKNKSKGIKEEQKEVLLKMYQFKQIRDKGDDYLLEADLKDGTVVTYDEVMKQIEKPSEKDLEDFAEQIGF